jgi:hypothetical protein
MNDNACKPLAAHFAGRQAKGLVDIKFYAHNATGIDPAKGCAEAAAIFDAIDKGDVEDFVFNDRHAS